MASIVICGDSQSVYPGKIAAKVLEAAGHTVVRVSNEGKGPDDYVRTPALWSVYIGAVRDANPDLIVLLFGTNDPRNARLRAALTKFKNDVAPKVILSGPPLYPRPEHQAKGLEIKTMYDEVFGEDYFDAYPFTPLSIERDSHGLHFSFEGARMWGEAIAAEVVRRLA
jgi:lysophospholipase L1-like esterase